MLQDIDIKEEIEKSYLSYAISVIVGRTIPDIRDGLKPVHRRILYAMSELHNHYNRPFKKSARIVGDVIGKYHPHSDGAIYDALIRMAQDFNMRIPLIDVQGNMGSIDGDKPAAMRYTECRLTQISNEFLNDLNKETVQFQPNYDNSTTEPTVLPTKIPNLLLNGTSGIAVGMASNIPPHNLGELIDAVIEAIDNPNITTKQLHSIIKGPDFPTGGIIYYDKQLLKAYETGRGNIKISSVLKIEKGPKGTKKIVIEEIPYMTNKITLLEKIEKFITEKQVNEISNLRDESDRNGIRIVIELKRNCQEDKLIQNLYKYTPLETSFGINMLCVVDNKPKTISLKDYIDLFIEHRKEIVLNRSNFEINKLKERVHILEGLKTALKNIDDIIKLIKNSSIEDTKNKLKTKFNLTNKQIKAILALTLQRLSKIEQNKLNQEYQESTTNIKMLNNIINDDNELNALIKQELQEIKEKFNEPRKTQILSHKLEQKTKENLLTDEQLIINLTNKGYIKAVNISEYPTQRRGGKGLLQGSDLIKVMLTCSAQQELIVFTNEGRYFLLQVQDIPIMSRAARGVHISTIINLPKNKTNPFDHKEEFVTSMTSFDSNEQNNEFLFFTTKKGIVKKSPLPLFKARKAKSGLPAITLKEGDKLLKVEKVTNDDLIAFVTKNSMTTIIKTSSIKESKTSRTAIGVLGMSIKPNDEIISSFKVKYSEDQYITSISKNGFGRKTKITNFKITNRGSTGLALLKTTKETEIAGAVYTTNNDNLIAITSKNTAIKIKTKDIPTHKRYALGSKIIKLEDNATVTLIGTTENGK